MARFGIVSVGSEQTERCSEHCTFTVAFYGTPFEYEIALVDIVTVQQSFAEQLAVYQIILVRCEFLPQPLKQKSNS